MNLIDSRSWAVEEAKKILIKIKNKTPEKGYVLFESGYGPSGLPHIGTFGEVVRTSFVRYAFQQLAPHIPTKLFVISDDMDGMRKIPDNVPNPDLLKDFIGKPLTSIPDPFGEKASYGEYMNSRLVSFLNRFGFDYTFLSATECYKNGTFDNFLVIAAERYQSLMDIMLPTLGEERQATYSPFMPIDPDTGIVIERGVELVDPKTKKIHYLVNGEKKEVMFTGGGCKLQWKCDFGMRWAAFQVDYEIYGKDHYPNEPVYRSICSALGVEPPVNYFYELFLDDDGKKISKSKGNGISIDQWIKYAPIESLSYYMYQKPKTAKKLYFDVIPKSVDEYISLHNNYINQPSEQKIDNPVLFVQSGRTPKYGKIEISFSLLLNLASACNPENPDILWGFIAKYNPEINKGSNELLSRMVECAISYYNEFVKTKKIYREVRDIELSVLQKLKHNLLNIDTSTDLPTAYQNATYQVSKDVGIEDKECFKIIYQTLLGTESGPRLGSFIALYGIDNFINMVDSKLT